MNETHDWIRTLESSVFPDASSVHFLEKDYVATFLRKATVLNELMSNTSDDYVRDLVDSEYTTPQWNKHRLKSYVMLDYPLSVIESIFRKERVQEIRQVNAGLYPFNSGCEINACACESPIGEPVVFFSEWLYAFLWDFFHAVSDVFPPRTRPGSGTPEQAEAAQRVKNDFVRKLATGIYRNWDTDLVVSSKRTTNSAKYNTLFALIFIWAHELGHLFLGHCQSSNVSSLAVGTNIEPPFELKAYNASQEQECDADMFASDIYFAYITKGMSFPDQGFLKASVAVGFEFFEMMARTEDVTAGGWSGASHPPTAFRLLNVFLRHTRLLTELGFAELYSILEQSAGRNDKISQYDYSKNVGTGALLVYD